MRAFVFGTSVLILFASTGSTAQTQRSAASATVHPLVTQAEYDRWQTELSNWMRWGKDDELGTLNLITPAKRKAALALVKDGVTVSLASNVQTEKAVDVP